MVYLKFLNKKKQGFGSLFSYFDSYRTKYYFGKTIFVNRGLSGYLKNCNNFWLSEIK